MLALLEKSEKTSTLRWLAMLLTRMMVKVEATNYGAAYRLNLGSRMDVFSFMVLIYTGNGK
jgi:hypothetical protein